MSYFIVWKFLKIKYKKDRMISQSIKSNKLILKSSLFLKNYIKCSWIVQKCYIFKVEIKLTIILIFLVLLYNI